jgi:pimeloyl-ACP methyl ester carboxylesterase
MAKTTAIVVGRIGVDGTSGNHLSRKTLLELHLMNMALEAIKQRYKFEGFHLAGQSGGSKLAFGLAAMRRDLGCVISGSGPLGAVTAKQWLRPGDPSKTYFDVIGSAGMLAQNGALRMMMITDPADQVVPAAKQTPMAQRLRQAGGAILQLFVEATDKKHHDAREYDVIAMAGCVLGRSDAEIARAVGTLVRRNADVNRLRQDEERARTTSQTASGTTLRQPGRS